MAEVDELKTRNRRTIGKLTLWAVGMFGFAYALVPLYDVICEVTGLNGKTNSVAIVDVPEGMQADTDRVITVEFVTRAARGMPWEFESEVRAVRMHPGEIKMVNFRARNTTDQVMIGQAIPSLAPGAAASHFMKTQCFCFDQQTLAANSEESMPMIFYLDPALPANVNTITLSYTLYDVTDRAGGAVAEVAAR